MTCYNQVVESNPNLKGSRRTHVTTVIAFNGKEYDAERISKCFTQCHSEEVEVKLVKPSSYPDAERPIAIKFNNEYHLLVGKLSTTKEKIKLSCITKHTLKRCELMDADPLAEPRTEHRPNLSRPKPNPENTQRRFLKKSTPVV